MLIDCALTGPRLTELWRRRGNRFSHQHARVYEEEGQPLGLALEYPFAEIARLDSGTVRGLFELIGLQFFFAMLKKPLLAWGLLSSREAEPGDWYLCVLAADPRFRGRGIGTALLEDTEARARSSGARALSLIVAEDNSSARRLYQRFGFRDRGRVRIDGFSSFQMVKEI